MDWLKHLLKPIFIWVFFLSGLVILNCSDEFAKKWGIDVFRASGFKPIVGLVTILTGCYCGIQLLISIKNKIHLFWLRRKHYQEVIKSLKSISNQEKTILAYCVAMSYQTVTVSISNSTVCALCSRGLMERPSGYMNILSVTHTIPDFVWYYINVNRKTVFGDDLTSPEVIRDLKTAFEQVTGFYD